MLLAPLQEGVGWLWGCHAFLLISVLRGSGFIRLAKFQGLAGCCNLRPWFGTFVHSVLLTDASSPRHPLSLCGLTCGKVRPQGVGVPRGPALWPIPQPPIDPGGASSSVSRQGTPCSWLSQQPLWYAFPGTG